MSKYKWRSGEDEVETNGSEFGLGRSRKSLEPTSWKPLEWHKKGLLLAQATNDKKGRGVKRVKSR